MDNRIMGHGRDLGWWGWSNSINKRKLKLNSGTPVSLFNVFIIEIKTSSLSGILT